MLTDLERDAPVEVISACFHNGLASATAALLTEAGIRVPVPGRLPPNDGGISFGQAAVAQARLARATP